jgi:acetoin utilization protein AcuC
LHELAHAHCGGRWLAVGSGGYDWVRVVPRSWAIVWSEMTGRSLPDRLPLSWMEQWSTFAGESWEGVYRDHPSVSPPSPRDEEIAHRNRLTVRAAQQVAALSS